MGEITRIILTPGDDVMTQGRIAKAAIEAGRPSGSPAFHLFTVGAKLYAVKWNKASVTVYPQGGK